MGLFVLDLSCALLASCIDLSFPLVARHAMYNMLPEKAYQVFFTVMAVFVVAFVLKAALQFVITYWGHMFGVRVEAEGGVIDGSIRNKLDQIKEVMHS